MRKINSKGYIGKLVVCILVTSNTLCALAQQAPIGFSAEAALAAGTDSNVLRLSDNETSDTIIEVAPELNFVELYGKHKFTAKYEGNYVQFNELDNLNYSGHRGTLNANFSHTTRLKTEFSYKYEDVVELPGEYNSVTQALDEFFKLKQHSLTAKVIYGRNDATGQVIVKYNYANRDYTNNDQDFRDYENNRITTTFFYKVFTNTRLVFETSSANIDNKNNLVNSGSDFVNYLVGAEWRPTVKTRGVIKIGHQNKDFDNPTFNDISGLAYNIDLFWRANTYSLVQVNASRSTRESSEFDVGSFASTDLNIRVKHEFTTTLAVDAFYSYRKDDDVIGNNISLKRNEYNIKFVYKSNNWFDSYFAVKQFSRNSDQTIYDIDNTQVTFGVVGYLGKRNI